MQRCLFSSSSEQIIGLYRMQQKKRLLFGLLAVTSLGWTNLCSALWAIEPPKQRAMTNDSRRDMITVLEAASPHPSLGEQAHVFDQFIGTWECDYANFAENGTITRGKEDVMFGGIFDGHAVQDVSESLAMVNLVARRAHAAQ